MNIHSPEAKDTFESLIKFIYTNLHCFPPGQVTLRGVDFTFYSFRSADYSEIYINAGRGTCFKFVDISHCAEYFSTSETEYAELFRINYNRTQSHKYSTEYGRDKDEVHFELCTIDIPDFHSVVAGCIYNVLSLPEYQQYRKYSVLVYPLQLKECLVPTGIEFE